jgi:hypothetical protein
MKNLRTGSLVSLALVFGLLALAARPICAQEQSPIVVDAYKQAFAPPLSQVSPIPPRSQWVSDPHTTETDGTPGNEPRSSVPSADSLAQESANETAAALSPLAATSGLNILGVGTGFHGFSIQADIAIANGAAGATQFVQFVNESFAVFNKSTGALEYGPADGNTLWQSLGAPCSTTTNLDEIAQYDKLANRWVMMMPVYGSDFSLCVAVSDTSSATSGGWHLYAFKVPGAKMPDYPKLGVWPDAYYISYNQSVDSVFQGAAACAVNRTAMLTGAAATMQCFLNTPASEGTLLPSDVDGTTAPPSGTPNYFLSFNVNDQSLNLFQFHVNWTTPSSSTFTGPTNIPVAAFIEPCGDTVSVFTPADNCVPQSGTSEKLGVFGDRLMYRLAYRNFGSHQTLIANHSVQTGTGSDQTGIRWYELRNTGSGFSVYQQGTYAPDSSYRFMGSIAMDKAGDIAMGYNVSSSTLSPTIRYTGRLSTDTLGTMESEVDLLSSVAHTSQTDTVRWGDYSSMAIDPTDDCTFWYTNQYQTTTGSDHWATRIASFHFPACTSTSTTTTPWTLVNKASSVGTPLKSLAVPATGSSHLIVVALMFNGTTSVTGITDSAGSTYVSAGARATSSQFSTEIWYTTSSKSGATTITPKFAGSPTQVEVTEWEVSGLSTAAPDAKKTASGNVTADNTVGPSVTTTAAGDFVISVLLAGSADFTSITSGNAFTNDFTTNGNGWAHLTSNAAKAGAYQASWTTAAAKGVYCASTVAFLAAN